MMAIELRFCLIDWTLFDYVRDLRSRRPGR
jgi:hypothetical protein